ncbi:MAG: PAS domain S-box protein, partial [Planctomycetaceae bacterium]|nr:PAS domain S-box protein [Planctomycetaceae bacterium]
MLDLVRFFSCSHDLGFITDVRGYVQAATAGAEAALGYTRAELKGVNLCTLDEGGGLRRFFEAAPTRSRMNLGFQLRTRSGAVLALSSLASILKDEKGVPMGWFIAAQDLRAAVAESRESQSILDALVNSIGAAVWSFDRNGTVLTWGRACEDAFGIPKGEAEGKFSIARLFASPVEYRRVLDAVDREGRCSGELLLIGADGAARPNHVSITPLVSDGFALGYTAVSFDITQRKRFEELQRSLFEQAGEAIVVVDMDGRRVIDVNDRACEIYCYSKEEFATLDAAVLRANPTVPVEEIDRRLTETGRYESDRETGRRKDGTDFPCALNIRLIHVGGKAYSVAVVRDLTPQRRAEEFFRVLFEKASDAVFLVEDGTLRVVEANESACRMLGYTREEFLRLKVPDLVPPELRSRIPKVRQNVERPSGYQRDRRMLLRKDGTSVATDHAISRLDFGGKPYYLASSRDLTAQEQSAQELSEAKAFLEHLQENASDGIALLDENGVYVSVNRRMLEIVGATREAMIGKSYMSRVDPAKLEGYRRYWQRQLDGEHITMRTTVERPDGRSVPVEISSAAIRRGSRAFIFAIVRDITDQVKSEERLKEAAEELERRVAERASELQKSEERFRAAFTQGGIGMALVGLDGRFLQVNRALCQIFGYSEEEFLATSFQSITHPEDRERSVELARHMIRDRQLFARLEKRYIHRGGKTVWFDLSTTLVQGPGGEDLYFVSSFQDITVRKEAEEQLRQSEARFRAITEATPVPATITRPDGRIVFANEAAARLFELERETAIGRMAHDFYADATDRDRMRSKLEAKGELSGYELRMRRADGTPFWTVVNLRIVTFEGGPAIFGSFVDIDARKRAEEALRESEGRYRALAENTGVGVWQVTIDGHTDYVNPAMLSMLGLSGMHELRGRTIEEFFPPSVLTQFGEAFWKAPQAGFSTEGEVVRPDGTRRQVVLFAAPMPASEGKPRTFIGSFIDISERKRAEMLLKKAHEELEQRVLERTAELARANELLQEEIGERKRAENALRLVLEGTAAVTGGSFFRSLARHLASALDVRIACVVQKSGRAGFARTLSFWNGTDFAEPLEYALEGTPCEDVFAGEACSYGHDVQRLFPQDRLLADVGAECYLGVPMMDSSGSVVGLISVMDVKPASDEGRKLSILKIFAARAGAELERQQGEEALRQSEERWRSLVQNAPDYILTVDRDCRILSLNRAVSGLTLDRVMGRSVFDYVPPESRPVVRDALDLVLRDGRPSSYETRAIGPDGTLAWYSTRVGPVVVRGEVTGATLIATEITERRNAERRQGVQHEVTQILADAASLEAALRGILRRVGEIMSWSVGLFWRVEAGTLRLADSWNAPSTGAAEFVQACRGLYPEPGKGSRGRAWRDRTVAFTLDVQRSGEFDRPDAAAAARLHSSLAIPLVDGDAVFGVLEFFTEEQREPDEALARTVSTLASQIGQFMERKRAEEALRFQKSLLESQSEAAIDGILVVSRDGVMMSFNRRFSQMWDIPEDVLRARTDERALGFVLDKLARPKEFLSRVRSLYEHPNEESRDEVPLKDGRTFDRYSAPVKGEQGAIYGRVWYFRDVTGRKQTEENLRRAAEETRRAYEDLKEAQAQLIRSEKLASIGMLVSGVAHEINNPLNVMYGNLQLLAEVSDVLLPLAKEGARSKKVRGVASRIAKFRGMIRDALKAARHAREIVRDFRNFARDTRTAELVDLNECLEEAVT